MMERADNPFCSGSAGMIMVLPTHLSKNDRAKLHRLNYKYVRGASKGKSWWVWKDTSHETL